MQIVDQWLKRPDLIVQQSVRVYVMTQAVLDLPLFVGKARRQKQESVEGRLLVDEVMGYSEVRQQHHPAKGCTYHGSKVASQYQQDQPNGKENVSQSF